MPSVHYADSKGKVALDDVTLWASSWYVQGVTEINTISRSHFDSASCKWAVNLSQGTILWDTRRVPACFFIRMQ